MKNPHSNSLRRLLLVLLVERTGDVCVLLLFERGRERVDGLVGRGWISRVEWIGDGPGRRREGKVSGREIRFQLGDEEGETTRELNERG